ncbi:MAG: CDP-alcohol phosphatidyltransferase family protein [Thermoplasmatales archaeon]|nr:CDP-alcohol phosphatidyltransferase family protein [Thermoplasmatales archaeon]
MVLDGRRKNIDPLLQFFAKHLSGINPNALTWLSVVFAFIAGLFFYFSTPELELVNYYFLIAALFVFLNGFFDAIDGKIAKFTKKASLRGDFLDHALDRYADVLIIGGLALSPWCDTRIGLLAIVGVLLTSYMGTQAQAVGHKRDYSGLLGRADRLVILIAAPVIQHVLLIYDIQKIGGFYLLEWTLICFAVVGNITAAQRFYSTLRYFKKGKNKKK